MFVQFDDSGFCGFVWAYYVYFACYKQEDMHIIMTRVNDRRFIENHLISFIISCVTINIIRTILNSNKLDAMKDDLVKRVFDIRSEVDRLIDSHQGIKHKPSTKLRISSQPLSLLPSTGTVSFKRKHDTGTYIIPIKKRRSARWA